MNSISTETVPQVWNDQDVQFFRITAALFSTDFCYGASVLLASYDHEGESESRSCCAGTAVTDFSQTHEVLA